MNTPITIELVRSILSKAESPSITNLNVKPKDIIRTVSAHYKVTTAQLCGPKRSRPLVDYRHIAMFLLYKDLGLPYIQVGQEFGGRDHTSIMHAVEKIESQLETSDELMTSLSAIRASLSGRG
jgi:chromosomal replication initiator protein